MKNLSLFALVLLFANCQAQFPSYIPFPYKTEKTLVADSAGVATAHPLATWAGTEILKKGGNAVDAAIAVQFALAVVYPQAGNIGGGGFLVYRSKTGETAALDYREKAPAAAVEKMYQDSTGNVVAGKSTFGALAAGVPGTVDGMWEAHQKYGSLEWATLLEHAIFLANKGFQITEQEAGNLNREKSNLIKNSHIIPTAFVKMHSWVAGDWLIQKELGRALLRIAQKGRNGFYYGETAALIEHTMREKGGAITAEDLKNYHSVWRKPLEFDHQDLHIIGMPPPSSGGVIVAQCLQMLENQSGLDSGFHSAEAVHLMVEAERRAYCDRATHLADPDFWQVPVENLLSENYLQQQMSNFSKEKATPSKAIAAGDFGKTEVKTGGAVKKESEETTHFSIVDKWGNAVSVTTTLNDSYGSRCVVNGAGFILNNEMDDFVSKPGVPNMYGAVGGEANKIVAGKRPLSSMTPTIVTRGGKLWLVVGTPGGTTIPTSVFQVLINIWKFKMTASEAVQASRFHHQWLPDAIAVEANALPPAVVERLRAMGHEVKERGAIGRVEAILMRPDGKLEVAADVRGDDSAGGY